MYSRTYWLVWGWWLVDILDTLNWTCYSCSSCNPDSSLVAHELMNCRAIKFDILCKKCPFAKKNTISCLTPYVRNLHFFLLFQKIFFLLIIVALFFYIFPYLNYFFHNFYHQHLNLKLLIFIFLFFNPSKTWFIRGQFLSKPWEFPSIDRLVLRYLSIKKIFS